MWPYQLAIGTCVDKAPIQWDFLLRSKRRRGGRGGGGSRKDPFNAVLISQTWPVDTFLQRKYTVKNFIGYYERELSACIYVFGKGFFNFNGYLFLIRSLKHADACLNLKDCILTTRTNSTFFCSGYIIRIYCRLQVGRGLPCQHACTVCH